MSNKCPYCYRPIGTWHKCPVLLPSGAKYKWQNDTTLIEELNIENREYKGIYQISELEVQELQDTLKTLEEENLNEEDRTIFSPINTSGYFQITGKHIKEMRDSVEKLLEAIGLEKKDYFNYDEVGNHIIHPLGDKIEWTDPITNATDLKKFQVKAIHIEDLRHYVQSIWYEQFNVTPVMEFYKSEGIYIGGDIKSEQNSYFFTGDKGEWLDRKSLYFFATNGAASGTYLETSYSIDDGSGGSSKIIIKANYNITVPYMYMSGYLFEVRPYLYKGINYKLKLNSKLSFQSNINLIYQIPVSLDFKSLGVIVRIEFDNAPLIVYWYGFGSSTYSPSQTIVLTKNELENFERSIVLDCISMHGITPNNITKIYFYVNSWVSHAFPSQTETCNIVNEFMVDNIKIT